VRGLKARAVARIVLAGGGEQEQSRRGAIS